MTSKELVDELQNVVNQCDSSNEQQAVKSVLLSLIGAICSRRQTALKDHVCDFTKRELTGIIASRN